MRSELRLTRDKCERLRAEVRALESAGSKTENTRLRNEAKRYRKALSNIRYRIDTGGDLDPDTLQSIVDAALDPREKGASGRV